MSAAIWLSYLFTYRRRRFLRRAYPAHLGVTIGCMPDRCHPNSSSRHQPPFAPTKFYYQSPFRSAIWPKLSANRYFHTFLAPPLFQILVMVYYYYSPKVMCTAGGAAWCIYLFIYPKTTGFLRRLQIREVLVTCRTAFIAKPTVTGVVTALV